MEWARHNIQVNAIALGWFVTSMNERAFVDPGIRERLLREVTGEVVFVDGGLTAA